MPIKSQSLQSWPRQLQIKGGTQDSSLQTGNSSCKVLCELMEVVFLFKTKSYLSVADDKGQDTAEAAEGPLINHSPIEDDHPSATVELFPIPDHSLSIPIILESSLKKVEIEQMLYPPYKPSRGDGPKITMSTAIDILHR
jgi:hypothetical protein